MSTYSQIYIQIVFAVKGRENNINPDWEERLYQYIAGIIRNNNQKILAINGTSNHIHILIGMNSSCRLSDLVREIKKATNSFIKENRFCRNGFKWQEGFGAFSYSRNQLDNVIKYILNQKTHHKNLTFQNEFMGYLKEHQIEYDERFLPEFYD